MAQLLAGGDEELFLRPQRQLPADRDRTGVAVVGLVAEVEVVLHALEVGQAGAPVPAAGTQLHPAVVILGLAAESDGGVDGAASPDHLAAGQVEPEVGIVVVPVVGGDAAAKADVEDLVGHVLAWVGSRLKQQHAQRRILGQPAGDDAAPAARADHDDVEVVRHNSLLGPERQE